MLKKKDIDAFVYIYALFDNYRDFPPSDLTGDIESVMNWDDEAAIVSNLTLIGIVGIQDPVRPEVSV